MSLTFLLFGLANADQEISLEYRLKIENISEYKEHLFFAHPWTLAGSKRADLNVFGPDGLLALDHAHLGDVQVYAIAKSIFQNSEQYGIRKEMDEMSAELNQIASDLQEVGFPEAKRRSHLERRRVLEALKADSQRRISEITAKGLPDGSISCGSPISPVQKGPSGGKTKHVDSLTITNLSPGQCTLQAVKQKAPPKSRFAKLDEKPEPEEKKGCDVIGGTGVLASLFPPLISVFFRRKGTRIR